MSGQLRWQRLRDLLAAALEVEPAQRGEFVERACPDDPELRAELHSLLRAHDVPGVLDRVGGTVREILEARAEAQLGERVGPYRLVRVIDYGGMGAVYLAEREGDFTQRVAIKLTRLGLDTPDVVARFVEERQILARLEHPNIARLLDGGITPGGRPYFAMEYVEGVPLHEYCAQNNLELKQRLQLFVQLCNAVHYAHQNLIVHRDLKPHNILITREGQAKLLDFGIAKLLARDSADARTGTQATTTRWFTPEYAAPEQVQARTITTATDIYALGLILYELLTGERAHRWKDASPAEIERIIVEREPDRPSQVVTAATLRRRLAGDLDTIVLKALQKDPARRYASAEQFAEDIERYLSGLPVRARPDTIAYRAAKFIRRHKVVLAAASVVGLTLLGGIAATSWQAQVATEQSRVARDERMRARLEAARAEQVSQFLVDLFRSSDPLDLRSDTVSARALLERGRAQIDRQFADQPTIHASMLDAIGRIYRNLGRYDQAQEVMSEALALRRETLEPNHSEIASNLTELAKLHHRFARNDLAEPLLREAITVWQQQPREPGAEMATTLASLGDIYLMKRDYKQAEQFYRQALAQRERALGPNNPEVAADLDNLATLMLHTRPDVADSLYSRALAMRRERFPPGHQALLQSLDGVAAARYFLGRLDEAEALHKEALRLRRQQLGNEHPEVAFSLENLAAVAEKQKRPQEAEAYFREALSVKRKLFPDQGPALIKPMIGLGRLLQARGACAEAVPLLREALAIRMQRKAPAQQIAELQGMLNACGSPARAQAAR